MTQRSRSIIPMSLCVTLFLASAGTAQAATLTIWPGSFKCISPDATGYLLSEEKVMGASTGYYFEAPIRLPVGSRLQSAVLSWSGTMFSQITCDIYRKPFSGDLDSLASFSHTVTPIAVPWTRFNLTFSAVDPVVRAGYRYFVRIWLYSTGSNFGGIKINYTPPSP